MTKYEHIKGMSVEEMAAKILGDSRYCCLHCVSTEECLTNRRYTCKSGIIQWLNSEVDE